MTTKQSNTAPEQREKKAKGKATRRTLYQRLHLISFRTGLIIGLVLACVALPVGNQRALERQMRAARQVWEGVVFEGYTVPADQRKSIPDVLRARAAEAANLVAVMRRYPDAAKPEREALVQARESMPRAGGSVTAYARVDAVLQACMTEAVDALYAQTKLTAEDAQLVLRVTRAFNDHAGKLGRMARDYNLAAERALDTYYDLPTRIFLEKPVLFDSL